MNCSLPPSNFSNKCIYVCMYVRTYSPCVFAGSGSRRRPRSRRNAVFQFVGEDLGDSSDEDKSSASRIASDPIRSSADVGLVRHYIRCNSSDSSDSDAIGDKEAATSPWMTRKHSPSPPVPTLPRANSNSVPLTLNEMSSNSARFDILQQLFQRTASTENVSVLRILQMVVSAIVELIPATRVDVMLGKSCDELLLMCRLSPSADGAVEVVQCRQRVKLHEGGGSGDLREDDHDGDGADLQLSDEDAEGWRDEGPASKRENQQPSKGGASSDARAPQQQQQQEQQQQQHYTTKGRSDQNSSSGGEEEETTFAFPKAVLRYSFQAHRCVTSAHPLCLQDPYFVDRRRMAFCCVPIKDARGKCSGLIYLENDTYSHAFNDGDVSLLGLIASFTGVAAANLQIFQSMQSLFYNSSEGMFTASMDGRLRTGNPALWKLLGKTATKIHFVDKGDQAQLVEELKEKHRVNNFETTLMSADGKKRQVFFNAHCTVTSSEVVDTFQGTTSGSIIRIIRIKCTIRAYVS